MSGLAVRVEEAFSERIEVLASFQDVESVFPSVNIDILLRLLARKKFSSAIANSVHHISHRSVIYSDCLGDGYRLAFTGLSQESVLSPLLYILYVADAFLGLPKTVRVLQFALYVKFDILKRGVGWTQKSIGMIRENFFELGLEFSPLKAVRVHFNAQGIVPGTVSVRIGREAIPSSPTVRFLDFLLDYRPTSTHHVDRVVKRCQYLVRS